MLVFDTNVLVYTVDENSDFRDACRQGLEESRSDPSPAFLTWNICYEFLRLTTHPQTFRSPWSRKMLGASWNYC